MAYDDNFLIMVTISLKYFFDHHVTEVFKLSSIGVMTIDKDQIIIKAIIEGDAQAFTVLVDRYKDLVFTLAFRMLKRREDAEEVCQDVFVKIYKSLYKFKGESKLSTWIYRVTYNSCLDIIKKQKRKHQEISIDRFDSYDIGFIDEKFEKLDKEVREKTIKACIEALPSEESFLLTLYYFEELTLKEISKIIGISSNSIKVKLFRSRKKLATILEKRLEPEIIENYGREHK